MSAESRATFFRQSGWVAFATVLGGVFLTAVHMVASSQAGMAEAEYSVFVTLLRIQLLISIPAAGLQAMFARQAAAAIDDTEKRELAATLRSVIFCIVLLWLASLVGLTVLQTFSSDFFQRWHIKNPAGVWLTFTVGLGFILLSVLRGVLTGRQDFWGLGWTFATDGIVRFAAIAVAMKLGHQAAGGMVAVFFGLLVTNALAAWWLRDLPLRAAAPVDWKPWLRRAIPLAIGPGVMVFMFSADVLFVQTTFAKGQTHFYMPAATVGMALFMFLTPLAIVMFPKLVSSKAEGGNSRALQHALTGTALLGGLAVASLLLFPKLPLWVLYFKNPVYWKSAPLVAWYIAALFPLLLANVLIGNLLAKERLGPLPCVLMLLLATGYAATLWSQRVPLLEMATVATVDKSILSAGSQHAFQRVIQIFGGFNLAILALAAGLSWHLKARDN